MSKYFILLSILVVVQMADLVVYHPRSLRDKVNKVDGSIKASLANFGNIHYEHSIVGKVWYDKDNEDGCEKFNLTVTAVGDPDIEPSPIVLVKRGNCPFVKKVRNVEHAGGYLAVIIDNKDNEIVEKIIMVDDGTGNGISIPSMLISKEDGEDILKEMKNCEDDPRKVCVQLLARFNLKHPDDRVEYEYYYSSSDDRSLDFIQNWGEYHKKFGKDVQFTPRFVTHPCPH